MPKQLKNALNRVESQSELWVKDWNCDWDDWTCDWSDGIQNWEKETMPKQLELALSRVNELAWANWENGSSDPWSNYSDHCDWEDWGDSSTWEDSSTQQNPLIIKWRLLTMLFQLIKAIQRVEITCSDWKKDWCCNWENYQD